jgi:hypothetical protein
VRRPVYSSNTEICNDAATLPVEIDPSAILYAHFLYVLFFPTDISGQIGSGDYDFVALQTCVTLNIISNPSPAFSEKPATFYPKARRLFKKGGGLLKFDRYSFLKSPRAFYFTLAYFNIVSVSFRFQNAYTIAN